MWYGVSAIGNAYASSLDASANTNGHRYFRPPSVAALSSSTLVAVAPSVELARPTTASDSNNTPQVFYTVQEIEAHFLKDPELTTPHMPTVYDASPLPKRVIKHAVESRQRLGWMVSSATAVNFGPLSRSRSYNRARALIQLQQRRRWESSAPQASRPFSRTRTT